MVHHKNRTSGNISSQGNPPPQHCVERDDVFKPYVEEMVFYGKNLVQDHGKVIMNDIPDNIVDGHWTSINDPIFNLPIAPMWVPTQKNHEHDKVLIGKGGFVAVNNLKKPSLNNDMNVHPDENSQQVVFFNKDGNSQLCSYYDKAENNTYYMLMDNKTHKILSAAIVQGYESSKGEVPAILVTPNGVGGFATATPHQFDDKTRDIAQVMNEIRDKVLHGECGAEQPVTTPPHAPVQHHGYKKKPCHCK